MVCARTAGTGLPVVLPSSSAVYNGFEKLGNDSLAFKLGGSHIPGYGICFQIGSPWISSSTSSVQPPRSGAVVQQRGLSVEAHVEMALQSTHPSGLPPVVPHGFAFALTAEHSLGRRISRLRFERLALLHQIVKEENAAQVSLAQEGPVCLKPFALRQHARLIHMLQGKQLLVFRIGALPSHRVFSLVLFRLLVLTLMSVCCWRALQYGIRVLCQSFVIIIHIHVSCGSKVCWRPLGLDVKLDEVSVRAAASLSFVHVRMLVADKLAIATMNCGSRLKKLQ